MQHMQAHVHLHASGIDGQPLVRIKSFATTDQHAQMRLYIQPIALGTMAYTLRVRRSRSCMALHHIRKTDSTVSLKQLK